MWIVLPNERIEDFEAFRDNLLAVWEPADAVEYERAMDAIIAWWRLRRIPTLEQGIIELGIAAAEERFLAGALKEVEITRAEDLCHAAGIRDPKEAVRIKEGTEEIHGQLVERRNKARATRETLAARTASSVIENANALALLSRFGTALSNQKDDAIEKLEARQAARGMD